MMIWMIRQLRGYLKIRASGGFTERFLNLASARDVELWEVRAKNGVLFACTNVKTYDKLRPVAKKSGMRLCVTERHGLPFLLQRVRARLGVAVGMAVFLAVVYTLSLFVWNIQITGNVALTEEQIRASMAGLGLDTGSLKSSLNLPVLKREAMLTMPELSWITLYLKGSTICIDLREGKKAPEIIPMDVPCNIRASRGGQILWVQAQTGQCLVKPGDVVAEDDMLITGISENAFGETLLHHATGKIVAATTRVLSEKVPLRQTVQTPTGRTIRRQRFQLFGVEIPLSVTPAPQGENFQRELTTTPVTFFGAKFPATLYTEEWLELQPEEVAYTPAQAEEIAAAALEERLENELKDVKITSRQKRLVVENNTLYYELTLNCEENIGYEDEILIN